MGWLNSADARSLACSEEALVELKKTDQVLLANRRCSLLRTASVSDVWGSLPVTREQFLDVPAEYDFPSLRATNCGFQVSFSTATFITITTRTGSWFLPGRSCNGTPWNTAFLRKKPYNKSKRNPSNSCDSSCQQSIPFRLFPVAIRFYNDPYNLTSYEFICYIRCNFRTRSCRHPALGQCSCVQNVP